MLRTVNNKQNKLLSNHQQLVRSPHETPFKCPESSLLVHLCYQIDSITCTKREIKTGLASSRWLKFHVPSTKEKFAARTGSEHSCRLNPSSVASKYTYVRMRAWNVKSLRVFRATLQCYIACVSCAWRNEYSGEVLPSILTV